MLYNDNAIASDESMSKMRDSYAKFSPVHTSSVDTLETKSILESGIYSLFTQEIDLLKSLSNYAQNVKKIRLFCL